MDLKQIYSNPGLEARRRALLGRLRSEQTLPNPTEDSGSIEREIDLGFASFRKQKKTQLSRWISECAQTLNATQREAFRTLLMAMSPCRRMISQRKYIGGMSRLARFSSRWLRGLAGFSARSYSASRQFSELSRYLLARWPVPTFFDEAWTEHSSDTHREWFIHVGIGGNLRTAAGLPFPLTKMMAHHALLAPDHVSIVGALRWGQVRALGGSERIARAILSTRLREPQVAEEFWLSVLQFFIANPMLDPHQVGPIVDWIYNQRFVGEPQRIIDGIVRGGTIPQPNLCMKGRSVQSVLHQVGRWHWELNGATDTGLLTWSPSGIRGYEQVEGDEGSQRFVRVEELTTSTELQAEGRAMHHCVASYARTCAHGASAIFSLRIEAGAGFDRRVTIEVDVRAKRIVQVRGRFNAMPQLIDECYLRNWAMAAGLSISFC